jgi:hypothetical protein
MPMRFLVSLQDEDLAIIAWTALAWPFLRANFPGTFGADSILDAGHPLRGLIWTVAAICAFVVIASHDEPVPGRAQRPNITPIDSEPETRIAMFGPLIVGMTLIGAGGLAGLGLNRDFGFAAVFVGIPILVAIRALKMSPALPHRTRRWLLAPFLLVGVSVFNDFAHSIGFSADFLRRAFGQTSSAGLGLTDAVTAVAGFTALFVIAAAAFYALLVAVPRQLILAEGSLRLWTVRFACFVVGSLAGFGLLAGFGF